MKTIKSTVNEIELTLVRGQFLGPYFEGVDLEGIFRDGTRFALAQETASRAVGKTQTEFPEVGESMFLPHHLGDVLLGTVVSVEPFEKTVKLVRGGVRHGAVGTIRVALDPDLPYTPTSRSSKHHSRNT